MASNFIGTRTITGAATAASLDTAIRATPGANQAAAYTGSGIGTALNFYADKDLYIGSSSSVTDTTSGILLPAGTPFTDYATGQFSNIVDITQIFIYAAVTATLTVYYRAN